MPKDSFYAPDVIEGEAVEFAHARAFNVAWGKPGGDDEIPAGVFVAGGVELDHSGVKRLIATLRRASKAAYGK